MASPLEAMLEPGERLLWRDPRYWVPARWLLFVLTSVPWLVVWTLLDLGAGVFFVFWMVLIGISLELGRPGSETLLTERRLLHRSNGKSGSAFELPLALIAKVEFGLSDGRRTVRVTKADGTNLELLELHGPQAFSLALAEAAAVPQPASIGPLVHVLPHRWLFTLTFGFLAVLKTLDLAGPYLSPGGWADPNSWLAACAVALAGVPGVFFGSLLGGLASYTILRPFVTFDEARTALRLTSESKCEVTLGRLLERMDSGWVGLLYGRTIPRNQTPSGNHG